MFMFTLLVNIIWGLIMIFLAYVLFSAVGFGLWMFFEWLATTPLLWIALGCLVFAVLPLVAIHSVSSFFEKLFEKLQ